jgi:hypothetical protein
MPIAHARWKKHKWPLYSLQPGIDRVESVVSIGNFNPRHNSNPRGKVDGSEFLFSHRWFCQGWDKGIYTPAAVFRMPNNTSTKWLLKRPKAGR